MRAKLLLFLAAASLFGLVAIGSQHYATTKDRIATAQHVSDLTMNEHVSAIKVGNSSCDECELRGAGEGWQSIKLPMTDLSSHFANHDNESVYYRWQVSIPEALLASDEAIAFTPGYIVHREYLVTVGGSVVAAGNGMSETGGIITNVAVISIPRTLVKDGIATIVVRGKVTPGALGIHHYGNVLLGPSQALATSHIQAEHAMGSYYLVFLASKGSVFLILSMFFLFTRPHPGLGAFLIFAGGVTLENFIIGNFLGDGFSFALKVPLYFACKAIAICGLWSFFRSLLPTPRPALVHGLFWLVAGGSIIGAAIDNVHGTAMFTVPGLHSLVNTWVCVAKRTCCPYTERLRYPN